MAERLAFRTTSSPSAERGLRSLRASVWHDKLGEALEMFEW
jgi:hypothetical protein